MQTLSLSHVVLNVKSCEESERFYNGVLGIPIAVTAHRADAHDLLHARQPPRLRHHGGPARRAAVGAGQPRPRGRRVQGGQLARRAARGEDEVEAAGVDVFWALDHVVTQSIYLHDPDGNEVELYVDGSDGWKANPDLVKEFAELEL